ncbi:MAG: inorganic phosphate transporter [Chloroflexota bacterium]
MDPHSAALGTLILLSMAFAWSMGAHYTGAVMGMPYASRSIRLWPALIALAILTVLGGTFLSHGVQETVGLQIVNAHRVTTSMLIVIEAGAFALTTVYTYAKVPTSTIQIVVFCIVGTASAAGVPVQWGTVGLLAATWVAAPLVAVILGFVFTHGLDLILPLQSSGRTTHVATSLPRLLVAVGLLASLALGANDVSNAVGVWSSIHLASYLVAGLLGGVAMGIGALTWGQRILNRVAFDIVKLDLSMASAAQFVQALVILLVVSQGLFTSMNQALIGAMGGAGLARGRHTINRATLYGILKGWAISPVTGFIVCFVLYRLLLLSSAG